MKGKKKTNKILRDANHGLLAPEVRSLPSRVYNKEGKRVSNVLYGPCIMCLESHVPGTQTLTNGSARFK